MLQVESIQDAVRIVPDIFWEAPEVQSGWQRAFAAILPLAGLSPLWRRGGGRHQQALAAPSVGSDGLCAVGEDDFGEGGEVMRSEHGSCGHSGLLTSCVGLGPPLPPTFR